jgi:hypothetical protein
MKYLLDVNVLLAAIWGTHTEHDRAEPSGGRTHPGYSSHSSKVIKPVELQDRGQPVLLARPAVPFSHKLGPASSLRSC